MVAEKKSNMSQPIRGQGGHIGFLIDTNYTNMVEDVEFRYVVAEKKSNMS